MKTGKSHISLTKVREILKDCQFNPNTPGPLALIVDADSEIYFRQRAIEQLKEIELYSLDGEGAEARLVLAIQLITLSIAKRKLSANSKRIVETDVNV